MDPEGIARDVCVLNVTAPEERWCYDIVEEEGANKFRKIVGEVKEMWENGSMSD